MTKVNPQAIGIDLGGTKVSAALVDAGGALRDLVVQPAQFDYGLKAVLNGLLALVERLAAGGPQPLAGIGIAASGRIDPQTGRVVGGVPLCEGYIGFSLGAQVSNSARLPVIVENDANAAAYAEYKLGAGRNARRLLCLTIGTGIGGGIVLDGKLLRGSGNAGEIGHIVIEKDGRPCACGRSGCLEQYVSRKIMAAEIVSAAQAGRLRTSLNKQALSTEQIIDLIKAGEPAVVEIFDRQLEYLAIGIENVVNTIDPDVIVISGQLSKLGALLTDRLAAKIRCSVDIKIAALENNAGLIGAGILAIEQNTSKIKN